jgi:hypothetical protein
MLEQQVDLQLVLFLLKLELNMGLGTPLSFMLSVHTTNLSSLSFFVPV